MESNSKVNVYLPNPIKAMINGIFWSVLLISVFIIINYLFIPVKNSIWLFLYPLVAVIVGVKDVIKEIKKRKSIIFIKNGKINHRNNFLNVVSYRLIPFFGFFYIFIVITNNKKHIFFLDLDNRIRNIIMSNLGINKYKKRKIDFITSNLDLLYFFLIFVTQYIVYYLKLSSKINIVL